MLSIWPAILALTVRHITQRTVLYCQLPTYVLYSGEGERAKYENGGEKGGNKRKIGTYMGGGVCNGKRDAWGVHIGVSWAGKKHVDPCR